MKPDLESRLSRALHNASTSTVVESSALDQITSRSNRTETRHGQSTDSRQLAAQRTTDFDPQDLEITPPSHPGSRLRLVLTTLASLVLVVAATGLWASRDGGERSITGETPTTARSEPSYTSAFPLAPRFEHLVVATGSGLFVWGGYSGQPSDKNLTDGAYFDATAGTWRVVPSAPLAKDRGDAIGAWTGTEVVVINGVDGHVQAAAFNPASFTWRALATPPIVNAANAMNRVLVVGATVVVVGVAEEDGNGPKGQVARLDLSTGKWATGQDPPVAYSSEFEAVSTGNEAVVVGRVDDNGAACGSIHVIAYNPTADSWRELPAGPSANRGLPVVAWTGSELFVGGSNLCMGGVARPDATSTADLLNVERGTWRATSLAPAPFVASGRYGEPWTGQSVVAVTEAGALLFYNPSSDSWQTGDTPFDGTTPINPSSTPLTVLGREIAVVSGGIDNGQSCCTIVDGMQTYAIPEGY